MPVEAYRQRLARALGEFWYDGAGPSHRDIDLVLDNFDMADAVSGSKRDRVYGAVTLAPDNVLPGLVAAFVELLEEQGFLRDPDEQQKGRIGLLKRRLRPFNLRLTEEGEVLGGISLAVEPDKMLDLPALRDHIRRIQIALEQEDTALLLGSSKELLETVSKFVLAQTGRASPEKFPALLTGAMEALGLHAKEVKGDGEVAADTRRILGGLQQIGLGINGLRNEHGTGHGRVEGIKLTLRHARLAAGSAVVLATVMVDTYEDPKAPWRSKS